MPAKNLSHLAQLIANDGHAASFQTLGQYRTALLKEISQASAAPEQDGATKFLLVSTPDGLQWTTKDGSKDHDRAKRAAHLSIEPLYTHADPSEMEQLRHEIAELQADIRSAKYGMSRQTQRADAAERKLGEVVQLLRAERIGSPHAVWRAIWVSSISAPHPLNPDPNPLNQAAGHAGGEASSCPCT